MTLINRNKTFRLLNQKGFTPLILLLILLSVGVLITAYFLQGRLNATPKASETEKSVSIISELTNQLVAESQKVNVSSAEQSKSSVAETVNIAKERKDELVKLADSDPQQFLNLTSLVGFENKLPAPVNPNIEKIVEVKGLLRAVHSDNFDNKTAGPIEYFIDAPEVQKSIGNINPNYYQVHFVKPPSLKTIGANVTLTGVALDSELVTETGDSSGANYNLQVNSKALDVVIGDLGEQKVGVFLVNFNNNPEQPVSVDQVKAMMFTNPDSVDRFYRETSFNQAYFTGDVHGWLTIDPGTVSCDLYNWKQKTEDLARARGINVDGYEFRVIVLPAGSCPASGYGELGSPASAHKTSWIFTPTNVGVFKHELGHNLGVHHANGLVCPDNDISDSYKNCDNREYADPTDVMGQNLSSQFNALHKVAVDWIPTSKVQEVSANGTYTIYNSEENTGPTQLLKIPTPYLSTDSSNHSAQDYYYLSFRKAIGFDSELPVTLLGGINIHLWNDDPFSQTRLIDIPAATNNGFDDSALNDNQDFNDSNANLRIKQLNHDSQKATVQVEFGQFPSGLISTPSNVCRIPIGEKTCSVLINWKTANTSSNVTIKVRETGMQFGSGISGSRQADFIDQPYNFDLYDNETLLATVEVYPESAPPKPTIKLNISCIPQNFTGNAVTISWTNSYNPVMSAFIDNTNQFFAPTHGSAFFKSSTTALNVPTDFTRYDNSIGITQFTINPDTTYYVWLYNTVGEGTVNTFSVPSCSKPVDDLTKPVYNIYRNDHGNGDNGDIHFLTIQKSERDGLLSAINPNGSPEWLAGNIAFQAFDQPQPDTIPIYGIYRAPRNGIDNGNIHFFTAHQSEAAGLVGTGHWNWQQPDIAWFAYDHQVPGTVPVYGLYRTDQSPVKDQEGTVINSNIHYFTTNFQEMNDLIKTGNWTSQNPAIVWYAFPP